MCNGNGKFAKGNQSVWGEVCNGYQSSSTVQTRWANEASSPRSTEAAPNWTQLSDLLHQNPPEPTLQTTAHPRTQTRPRLTMAEPPPEPSPAAPAPAPTPTRNIFAIPSPLRRLFNRFPLRTTPSNPLPARCAVADPDGTPVLFVFTDEVGAKKGSPSFNPACLKWQVRIIQALRRIQLHS